MTGEIGTDRLLDAVGAFLTAKVMPQVDPATAFQIRVSVNALALAARAIRDDGAAERGEAERLRALLEADESGTVDALNERLCAMIADGQFDLSDPALLAHLWERSLDRLGIDQPNYSAYRAHRGGGD